MLISLIRPIINTQNWVFNKACKFQQANKDPNKVIEQAGHKFQEDIPRYLRQLGMFDTDAIRDQFTDI